MPESFCEWVRSILITEPQTIVNIFVPIDWDCHFLYKQLLHHETRDNVVVFLNRPGKSPRKFEFSADPSWIPVISKLAQRDASAAS